MLAGICAGGRPQGRSLPRMVDLDIRKFFDSVPWDFIVKAVEANTDRCLGHPVCETVALGPAADGRRQPRGKGPRNPAGSAVSPVLANLFLHYAFDMWLARKFPSVPFERYVDDAVVHCRSEKQARMIRAALEERMGQVA